jgi:hypothetical protein
VDVELDSSVLSTPPLNQGEQFLDAYTVILLIDDREQFMNASKG